MCFQVTVTHSFILLLICVMNFYQAFTVIQTIVGTGFFACLPYLLFLPILQPGLQLPFVWCWQPVHSAGCILSCRLTIFQMNTCTLVSSTLLVPHVKIELPVPPKPTLSMSSPLISALSDLSINYTFNWCLLRTIFRVLLKMLKIQQWTKQASYFHKACSTEVVRQQKAVTKQQKTKYR